MKIITYSIEEVTQQLGAPSSRWVIEQLRSGRFPGRKVGRNWRLTEQDIAESLEACRNDCPAITQAKQSISVAGLTPTSRKRLTGRSRILKKATPGPGDSYTAEVPSLPGDHR